MAKDTTREPIDSTFFVGDKTIEEGEPVRIIRRQVNKQEELAWGYGSARDGQTRPEYVGKIRDVDLQVTNDGGSTYERAVGTLVHAYTNYNEEEGWVRKAVYDTEDVYNSSEPFPVVGSKLEHPHYLDVYFVARRGTSTADISGFTFASGQSTYNAIASQKNK